MAILKHGQRFFALPDTSSECTQDISTDDILELLMAFFFSLNMKRISRKKLGKIWPTFLSNLQRHGIEIPAAQNGTLSLENGIGSMMRDGLLLSYVQGDDTVYMLELTERRVARLRECSNEKLLGAIMLCAPKTVITYKKLSD